MDSNLLQPNFFVYQITVSLRLLALWGIVNEYICLDFVSKGEEVKTFITLKDVAKVHT